MAKLVFAYMLRSTVKNKLQINPKTRRPFNCLGILVAISIAALQSGGIAQEIQIGSDPTPCSRIEKGPDFLFIAYEHNSQDKASNPDAILLRLHNNSTCSVMITSGSAENFLKPLPANPTITQRLKSEVEYTLPDNVLVPEVQYEFNAYGRERNGIGGDSFFGFYLLPKRSILFEVPIRHFGELGRGNKIAVPFQYEWEAKDQKGNIDPSVVSRVEFWTDSLPTELKSRLKRYFVHNKNRKRRS